MCDVIKEILITEKEFAEANYKGLNQALVYIKYNLIDSDGNMYLTVDSLIERTDKITSSINTYLRKVNVKLYRFYQTYMDKYLIEDKLYQIIDQSNKREISPVKFYLIALNEIHPFYHGNGRTCKILFGSVDKKNLLMRQKLKKLIIQNESLLY